MELIYWLSIFYLSGILANIVFAVLFVWLEVVRGNEIDPFSLDCPLALLESILALHKSSELLLSSWGTFFTLFYVFVLELIYPSE